MRRRSPALLAVTLVAIVCGLIGLAAEQTPGTAPAAPKAQPTKAASPARMDAATQTASIIWFGNAIEAAAMGRLLKATNQQTELQRILAILEASRVALTRFNSEIGCRWACPPGECSPDCHPKTDIVPSLAPIDPELLKHPGNGPIILNWYVATLENLALDAPGARDADVRSQLRGALDKIAARQ